MAVIDDLNKLAAQDVVYLTRSLSGQFRTSTEVFRGRVRQALNGDWVFNAFTGQNGVVGFVLGNPTQMPAGLSAGWDSSESPAAGIQVTIGFQVNLATGVPPSPPLNEVIVLSTVVPQDFTE